MTDVDDVKARLDIVETVSSHVALQKSGRYFKALCPFHTEKTPSFIVNPERQSWRCFGGCATGGDVISFVMRVEGLDFGAALRLLAEKTGVPLSRGPDRGNSDGLYRANGLAAQFYQEVLEDSQRGRQGRTYLKDRGVDEKAARAFGLGFCPGQRDGLKSYLLGLGLEEDEAVEAGLLYRDEGGGTRDFFRGRLIFPIHDHRGRTVGFGGRALDDSNPKYLNTSRTPVFDKRGTLYGLHLAAESIREKGKGIVVEGYMDVIAAHQHGYTNVVASMGTALTEQQVSRLKPLGSEFVLALDPDTAGQEATLRSLESSWRLFEGQAVDGRRRTVGTLYRREPLTLSIAALPAGADPDKLIRQDAGEWERRTDEGVPFMEFYISAIASRYDLTSSQERQQAADALAPAINAASPVEQDRYIRSASATLNVSEEALKASIRSRGAIPARSRRAPSSAAPQAAESLPARDEDPLEDYTLALLLDEPEFRYLAADFPPECFRNSEHREVFTRWLGSTTMDDLWESLDRSLHERLSDLTQRSLGHGDQRERETGLKQCLERLRRRQYVEEQEELLASEDASSPPDREKEEAIANVNSRLRESFSEPIR